MLPLIIASILSAPPDWKSDPDHATVVQRDAQAHLPEGVQAQIQVESYLAPVAHGAQLIASATMIAVNGDAGANGLARARIDELKALPDVGTAGGDKVRTVSWSETPDTDGKIIEARIEYADDTIGIVSLIRKVWLRPAHADGKPDVLVELEGDCEIAADQAATLRAPCEQALTTIVLPPVDQRGAISAPAAPPPKDDDGDDDSAGSGSASASASAAPPPTIAPAPAGDLPAGPVIKTMPAPDDSRDMRPFYIGGALVLMAALLLWNRKKRQEMLAEEEAAAKKKEADDKAAAKKKAAAKEDAAPKEEDS
jgi:hypothetical protein